MKNNQDLKIKFNPYNCFGLREEWIINFFNKRTNLLENLNLGSVQQTSLLYYLKDIEFINKKRNLTILFNTIQSFFNQYTIYKKLIWSIIWINLSNKTAIFKNWLTLNKGKYNKNQILETIIDYYKQYNRHVENAYLALIGTIERTPIGSELKQGIVIKEKGKRVVIKEGDPDISEIAIMYNLYKFAEQTSIYEFSLDEIESNTLSPQKIFTISTKKTENLLKSSWDTNLFKILELEKSYKIKLYNNINSLDILKFFGDKNAI